MRLEDSFSVVCGPRLLQRFSLTVISAHTALPLSFSQHNVEIASIRISAPYVSWCHRGSRQERFLGSDQLFVNNGDYTFVPSDYGDGL